MKQYDYYTKNVSINDSLLTEVYDIHFWVKYIDSVETQEMWNVDEGRPVGIPNIQEGEVIIDVSHFAKDDSWHTYEMAAASKMIKLSDCEELWIEKTFIKKDGVLVNNEVERVSVTEEEFIQSMLKCRIESI